MSNYNNGREDTSRRTVLKLLGATGVTATGIGAFGGSAAAAPDVTVEDDENTYTPESSDLTIEGGNPNATFQNVDVLITSIDESAGTASGVVSGTVLPTKNANENAAKDFEVEFEDAPAEVVGSSGKIMNSGAANLGALQVTELIRLEIPDLFLDVLGLQISLDLELLVEADCDGALLGRLLGNLLGDC